MNDAELADLGARLERAPALSGRYRIQKALGSGSAAVVFLARDLRHSRKVALKVLLPDIVSVVDVQRFAREIEIAARLTHPRIVPLHDSGEADGLLYYVMPYLEERSLAARLEREKQLPVADAIRIAREVAEALHYAHERSIVHRDVKPGNILLTTAGAVLSDFGIARAIQGGGNARLTGTGVVIGTPLYMAPEQNEPGANIDGRADQYGLACVLYEMLCGQPPFTGATRWIVFSRHALDPVPPIRSARSSVPTSVEAAIERALAKSPADRFPTIEEFSGALSAPLPGAGLSGETRSGGPASPAEEDGTAVAPSRRPEGVTRGGGDGDERGARLRKVAGPLLGILLLLGLAALIGPGLSDGSDDRSPEVITFDVPPPAGVVFTDRARTVSAVSPGGGEIVFVGTDSTGRRSLWVQPLSERRAVRVPGSQRAMTPFWSADGRWIGFFQDRNLVIKPRAGGTARTVGPGSKDARGASWGADGTILFAPSPQSGIFRTSAAEPRVQRLTTPDPERGEIGHMWPELLPGDREFLYFVASDRDSIQGIYAGSLDGGERRRIVGSPARGSFAADHLLFVREGALLAQPLDVASLTLTGRPTLLADSIATAATYYAVFSASENGVLVYASGASRDVSRLTWFDSAGVRREAAYDETGYLQNPELSPDGRFLAFETYDQSDADIRIVDLRVGGSTRIRDPESHAMFPVWSSDGRHLAFAVERPGGWEVYRKAVHRSDEPEKLWSGSGFLVLSDWSPDQRTLLFYERSSEGDFDIRALDASGGGGTRAVVDGPGDQGSARFSPDGRFFAYVSSEPGDYHVFVEPFPRTGARCRVSSSGGWQPTWGTERGRLFFLDDAGVLMTTRLDLGSLDPCRPQVPRPLYRTPVRNPSTARNHFTVSPIDGRLLFNAPVTQRGEPWLTVVVGWPATLNGSG